MNRRMSWVCDCTGWTPQWRLTLTAVSTVKNRMPTLTCPGRHALDGPKHTAPVSALHYSTSLFWYLHFPVNSFFSLPHIREWVHRSFYNVELSSWSWKTDEEWRLWTFSSLCTSLNIPTLKEHVRSGI